ncbi:hypothetical protein LDENG_00242160 [Lucifuga dentata]|nr:hypothetical protein LDENG_00242160 [Lucifuga dentata]
MSFRLGCAVWMCGFCQAWRGPRALVRFYVQVPARHTSYNCDLILSCNLGLRRLLDQCLRPSPPFGAGCSQGDQDSGDLDLVHETSQIKPLYCLLLSLLVCVVVCPGLLCRRFLASLLLHRLNHYTGYYWLLLSLLVSVFLFVFVLLFRCLALLDKNCLF